MPPKEDSNGGVLIDSLQKAAVERKPKEPQIQQLDMEEFYEAKSKALRDRPAAEKQLWWIHGKGYDLDEFVNRHPGGKEAILLGKGRDCSALVESYHPFSSRHIKVLEKFLRPGARPSDATSHNYNSNKNQKHNALGGQEDFFYELMKERVAAVLKKKGIDPLEDRGASTGRTLYYLVIFVACVTTGYLHVKVSSCCVTLFSPLR